MKPASDELTPDGVADERPDREQLMTVRAEERDHILILTVEGDVDGLTAPRLSTAVAEAFRGLAGRSLVLDLTRVRFIGSVGLRTLRDTAREAARHQGVQPLRVVVDQARQVIRPIEIAGLDQILALHHTVDDAIAAGDLR
ncbi:anti-sigma factor antagonist [Actinophytocola oryzae]|uniref:Anti-sigma factor antagonist n=1 Tax=Actinophytocola oryzae TaxID=502181 RepID=A0A4R7VAT4_9PSEU|nr:anti-sigma factor antagonist [Actinophytocola oryzae]TDV46078.1 anti-anti-sigma factor [Actinophytocola oryzae]